MKKKTIVIIICLFFAFNINAQDDDLYPNDSIKIFSELQSTKNDEVIFGVKNNGLERCYRFYNERWNLNWICLYKNSEFVWCCKVGQYDEFGLSLDYFNYNCKFFTDTIAFKIPYETGKIWLDFFYYKGVQRIITYSKSSKLMKELTLKSWSGKYKEYYESGIIKLIREGEFYGDNKLLKGKEYFYDENGKLINSIEIDFSKKE
jgi:hypothetical protein